MSVKIHLKLVYGYKHAAVCLQTFAMIAIPTSSKTPQLDGRSKKACPMQMLFPRYWCRLFDVITKEEKNVHTDGCTRLGKPRFNIGHQVTSNCHAFDSVFLPYWYILRAVFATASTAHNRFAMHNLSANKFTWIIDNWFLFYCRWCYCDVFWFLIFRRFFAFDISTNVRSKKWHLFRQSFRQNARCLLVVRTKAFVHNNKVREHLIVHPMGYANLAQLYNEPAPNITWCVECQIASWS